MEKMGIPADSISFARQISLSASQVPALDKKSEGDQRQNALPSLSPPSLAQHSHTTIRYSSSRGCLKFLAANRSQQAVAPSRGTPPVGLIITQHPNKRMAW